MFVDSEVLLDVSFEVACGRLVSLIHSGALLTESQHAYGTEIVGLSRAGPLGAVRGMSRLVEVKFREPVNHGDSVKVALRWQAIGSSGGLFPALDADITLAKAGGAGASLRLEGAYRPPLGALGDGLDRAILHRVASATIRVFLGRVAAAIASPAPVTGAAGGNGGQGSSWLPPETEAL